MSVAHGELRPSLRAGRRSGVLARTSISARLNRGGPDVICRVQSGASDELPLSGHALRWQSVASAGRRRLTERRACGRTTCSCWSAQWRPHTRGKPRLLDVGRRILARDRFAPDSPLEEVGLELLVPLARVSLGFPGEKWPQADRLCVGLIVSANTAAISRVTLAAIASANPGKSMTFSDYSARLF